MTKRRILPVWLLLLPVSLLHGAQNPFPDSLRDLARLKQDSNPARLEALQKMLQERGIPYELQTFESGASPHGRTQGTNLIVSFGNGPREITLGAHYDALELPGGRMVDGMIDNGAATIILVRVAEALKGRDLRHRVRIVFFDMEEIGLVGSRAYVASRKSEIVAAIILDIAGYGDALGYGFGRAKETARIRKALLMACADQLLTCVDSPNYPTSDDRSFQNANIPVVSLGFSPRLAAMQAWLLLNGGESSGMEKGLVPQVFTIIHSPEDNIGRIDPAALDLEYTLVLNTLLKLDAARE
ncbi:MAG: Zn-dependent exopeptidase [Acidobacteria bacterium]|nr:Zn-dependent exopeptidase [Acidobacteriota bacterium]